MVLLMVLLVLMFVMMVLLMELSWYFFKVVVDGRAEGVQVAGVLVFGRPQFLLFAAGQFELPFLEVVDLFC